VYFIIYISTCVFCSCYRFVSRQKSTPIKSEAVIKPEKIKKARKISQTAKVNKGPPFNKFDSEKIQALVELETRKEKKSTPPLRPTSIFNHMSSIMGSSSSSGASSSLLSSATSGSTSKITGTTCQSMEELLEWQWDQTGTLLMQQAEASDSELVNRLSQHDLTAILFSVASLLSCLHDLKNENEQLLSKQFKLSHRRDHLKAVNAKLQLQLSTKTSLSSCAPSITPATVTNAIDNRTISRPTTTSNLPSSTKHPSKTQKSSDQHHYKQASTANIVNRDVRSHQVMDSKSMFIQPQQQQPQQQQQHVLPMPSWGSSSSTMQKTEQPINQQTLALLKQYQQQQQQQQHHGYVTTAVAQPIASTPPVSNIITQTDLVTFLNNQLHSQLTNSNQNPTAMIASTQKPISQDIHITSNNGSNMELIYQAIQQKKQQQQQQQQQQLQIQQHFYYNTNKMVPASATPGGVMNTIDSSVPQTPGNYLITTWVGNGSHLSSLSPSIVGSRQALRST